MLTSYKKEPRTRGRLAIGTNIKRQIKPSNASVKMIKTRHGGSIKNAYNLRKKWHHWPEHLSVRKGET